MVLLILYSGAKVNKLLLHTNKNKKKLLKMQKYQLRRFFIQSA